MMIEAEVELRNLLRESLSGGAVAHGAFVLAARTVLRPFFWSRLRGRSEDAEDLLQETLIALHARRASYDPSLPVLAWIHGIAKYRLIDHWRRCKRRRGQISVEAAYGVCTPPLDEVVDAQLDVIRLLALLPKQQQEAIRLVKLEGLSVADAARRMGLGPSNVKISTHRGMKTLMRLMADVENPSPCTQRGRSLAEPI